MDVQQTSSVLDEMSSTANEGQMVDNVMTVLPIELTNATGTYLQDLNEDCLLEIFSRNSLTPMDLCSVAETCKRFKQITQRLFSKGFAIEHSYTGCTYTFSSKDHSELECTFQDIERILKHFGLHLSELCVGNDPPLVNLIARYCDDITLKHLEMRGFKGTELVLAGLQVDSILQRLPQLCVFHCKLPVAPWNMNWDSLIELEISFCENIAALLSKTFPILERFCFRSDYDSGSKDLTRRKNDIEALSEFVGRHGYLKKFEIYGDTDDICKLLHAISCSCNELVEVTLANLGAAFFDISHLQNLAKLKVLRIESFYGPTEHTTHCEAIDFSQAFKSLKTMEIFFFGEEGPYVGLTQIFDVVSRLQGLCELKLGRQYDLKLIPWERLTQLRKVCLSELRGQSYLLDIIRLVIRHLINLEELELEYRYRLEKEEFSEIAKIVEGRGDVLTLVCNYDFNYEENCNEKGKVKLIKKTKP